MADSKKYNGSTWEHSLRKLTTATDAITTLPAVLYPNDTTATVGISGNTVQSGTPTPDSPIQPSECGEMTGNLFDITAFVQGIVPNRCTTSYDSTTNTLTINSTGADAHTGNNNTYHIPVTGGETYSLSWQTSSQGGDVYIFENGLTDSSHLHAWNSSLNKGTLTMRSDTTFIIVRVGCFNANVTKTYTNIRLYVGSATQPYEPYGVKIPISSASTTTPVYLGEVQTTRRVKKLVLTGEESYDYQSQYSRYVFIVMDAFAEDTRKTQCFCSHYQSVHNGEPIDDVPNNSIYINQQQAGTQFCIKTESITSVADFKSYLAQQYAAGTPVTVWYVLETEETGIVNEPLMKIGDYGDTVSGISIPTITGKDTFDVETALKPSEATLSYTGWHDATVEEWDGSDWQ